MCRLCLEASHRKEHRSLWPNCPWRRKNQLLHICSWSTVSSSFSSPQRLASFKTVTLWLMKYRRTGRKGTGWANREKVPQIPIKCVFPLGLSGNWREKKFCRLNEIFISIPLSWGTLSLFTPHVPSRSVCRFFLWIPTSHNLPVSYKFVYPFVSFSCPDCLWRMMIFASFSATILFIWCHDGKLLQHVILRYRSKNSLPFTQTMLGDNDCLFDVFVLRWRANIINFTIIGCPKKCSGVP